MRWFTGWKTHGNLMYNLLTNIVRGPLYDELRVEPELLGICSNRRRMWCEAKENQDWKTEICKPSQMMFPCLSMFFQWLSFFIHVYPCLCYSQPFQVGAFTTKKGQPMTWPAHEVLLTAYFYWFEGSLKRCSSLDSHLARRFAIGFQECRQKQTICHGLVWGCLAQVSWKLNIVPSGTGEMEKETTCTLW